MQLCLGTENLSVDVYRNRDRIIVEGVGGDFSKEYAVTEILQREAGRICPDCNCDNPMNCLALRLARKT